MSLKCQFKEAGAFIERLNPEDSAALERICMEIRAAEIKLQEKSKTIMTRCLERSEGICCRNVQLDLIIDKWDFLYILVLKPGLKDKIARCLEKEIPFFTSDCIFLENGAGPCIFPFDARPEVCLVTFCDDTSPIKKEIAEVKRKFFKLTWFALLRKPAAARKWLMRKWLRAKGR